MNEQDQYGTTKTAEPIPVPKNMPFVTSTPNPTASPAPGVMDAYNTIVYRDLLARREQRTGGA